MVPYRGGSLGRSPAPRLRTCRSRSLLNLYPQDRLLHASGLDPSTLNLPPERVEQVLKARLGQMQGERCGEPCGVSGALGGYPGLSSHTKRTAARVAHEH